MDVGCLYIQFDYFSHNGFVTEKTFGEIAMRQVVDRVCLSSVIKLDEIVVFVHDVSDLYLHGFVSKFYDINAMRKILYGT